MIDLFLLVVVVGSTYVLTRAHCDYQFRSFLVGYLRLTDEEIQAVDERGGWRAY